MKIDKEKVVGTAKQISSIAIHGSTGSLACGLVRLLVPPGVGIAAQGAMCLGGMLVGSFLGHKVSEYVEEEIDETIEGFEQFAAEIKKQTDVIQDKDLIKETIEEGEQA